MKGLGMCLTGDASVWRPEFKFSITLTKAGCSGTHLTQHGGTDTKKH